MKVVMLKPGEYAEVTEIGNELEDMQEVVGGFIEAVYPFDDEVAIVCNEEGKMADLEPCRGLRYPDTDKLYDFLAGPCFICGLTEDDFGDIPDDLARKYLDMFYEPEILVKTADGLDMIKNSEAILQIFGL